ncbi:EboA domain-containing protein [Olivibacter domesticus]|uniref:DNA alkylation repair enzyme n=1 Tax=Olivibacter domesticus TaxID=407022 RepID=A0A1H7XYR9_OLID1|nr:EboA domain-containing protein [Olivibacter domesticus]SEM38258.1 hypothetical protein SAMN05661044_05035 [Olivibacter domesticus]
MNVEDRTLFKALISTIIHSNLEATELTWFLRQADAIESNPAEIFTPFVAINRKLGKERVHVSQPQEKEVGQLMSGFKFSDWDKHRLARLGLLLAVKSEGRIDYMALIERLFMHADMNELIALYSALSVLEHPNEWVLRCTEGIRSNIGSVLDAIMYENPYPANYLPESAWNQLVLKAFFTDKDLGRILGLHARMNETLILSLVDYAQERLAAGRTVNPLLWNMIGQENRF